MASQENKNHKMIIFMLISLIFFISALAIYAVKLQLGAKRTRAPLNIDGVYLTQSQKISDFKLTDQNGNLFTRDKMLDHWTFMFFGFTNCGMVCPTTLSELNKMVKHLENDIPKNELPQIVLITVDPERDSVKRMKEYLNAFNPNFIGLRGEEESLSLLKKELHIASAKMEAGANKNQYTINHSAEIMVFNPKAELQAFLSYPHTAAQMEKDYKLIIQQNS